MRNNRKSGRSKKSDSDSALQILKNKCRDLMKENKSLKRRNAKLERMARQTEEHADKKPSPIPKKESKKESLICNNKKCNSSDLKIIRVSRRNGELKILECNECGKREKIGDRESKS